MKKITGSLVVIIITAAVVPTAQQTPAGPAQEAEAVLRALTEVKKDATNKQSAEPLKASAPIDPVRTIVTRYADIVARGLAVGGEADREVVRLLQEIANVETPTSTGGDRRSDGAAGSRSFDASDQGVRSDPAAPAPASSGSVSRSPSFGELRALAARLRQVLTELEAMLDHPDATRSR